MTFYPHGRGWNIPTTLLLPYPHVSRLGRDVSVLGWVVFLPTTSRVQSHRSAHEKYSLLSDFRVRLLLFPCSSEYEVSEVRGLQVSLVFFSLPLQTHTSVTPETLTFLSNSLNLRGLTVTKRT